MGAFINREVILKVAKLSALELNEQDILLLLERLNQIVNYVNQLEKVKTDGAPEFTVIDRNDVFRADTVTDALPVDAVLSNAPEQGRSCFKLPKVM